MTAGISPSSRVDRDALLAWFERNRSRSSQLFDMLDPAAYYTRPIALRHPIVFYEGHLPAFNVITLIKRGLGRPGADESLEKLFARGIDPSDEQAAKKSQKDVWPSRDEVQRYARQADALIEAALRDAPIDQPRHPVLDRAEGAYTMLEHEAMHQETLLYMWHRLPSSLKRRPENAPPIVFGGPPPERRTVRVPAGRATLGARRGDIPFGWDNEYSSLTVQVPEFEIDVYNVTNLDFLAFVEAGGYSNPAYWTPETWKWRQEQGLEYPMFWERRGGAWFWRGQFETFPLPPAWPVYVSQAEATAYARWKGRRLPTEAEFHRAAYGAPGDVERQQPWGDEAPRATHGNFDFANWDPVPVGSFPAGASAWGIEDLVGNGWEWTMTPFAGFPGFEPMPSYPEYSADFFDGEHFVMKGASPVTDRSLIRRSFRNWFRATYPYVYATFRLVTPQDAPRTQGERQ